eukprot:TRINITY_DN2680_c0_g1_i2.p1 TRINITY_DN2680_c0_g1~~TRINITY_DN2680_c0_g1_i2.p1  ORF type:complete len:132 (+),score=43.91 TRINITY_DN2680_c0_g1_i2:61-456(+)
MVPIFLISLILFVSLIVQIRFQPYRIPHDNFFEIITLSHALLSFQFSILATSSTLVTASSAQVVLDVIDISGYIMFFIILLFCAPQSIRDKVAGWLTQKPAEGEKEKEDEAVDMELVQLQKQGGRRRSIIT